MEGLYVSQGPGNHTFTHLYSQHNVLVVFLYKVAYVYSHIKRSAHCTIAMAKINFSKYLNKEILNSPEIFSTGHVH